MSTRQFRPLAGAMAAGIGLGTVGCSYGLFQTARTEPPRTIGGHIGQTLVMNEIDDQGGRNTSTNLGVEPEFRIGATDHMDVGLGPFFGLGLRGDVKYNFFEPTERLALAGRVGGGVNPPYAVYNALGGVIGSYRVFRLVEPYAGATFSNYWIRGYEQPEMELEPGERLAESKGYGDGLLQVVVGIQLPAGTGRAFMVEVGRWIPLQNDPGDYYMFSPSTIIGIAYRFGALDPLRAERQREKEREEVEKRRRYRTGPEGPPRPARPKPRHLDPTGPKPPSGNNTGSSRPLFE
jgi:hypothetical protein